MIKYIKSEGYSYKEHYNDLTDKQFTLVGATMSDSEHSTLGNSKMDRLETYSIFVRNIDLSVFQNKVVNMLHSAINDGVNVSLGNNVDVENVENGFKIILIFNIRG